MRSIGGLAVAAAGLTIACPAAAAPPPIPLPDCPVPVASSALAPGQVAVGYTVRQGETVETFDVEILDVMENGIAPGRDLIIVETGGPVIEAGGADGGGISAGMSGSPVYTLDGELIGAVGYGFSAAPSPIGGVTPAEDMLALLGEASGAFAARAGQRRTLDLDRSARSAARDAGASRAQVRAGLARLPLPLTFSGLGSQRIGVLADAAERRGLPFTVTSGASAAAVTPTATVAGGDAFAGMLAFGDATIAATGTTTYVCDGEVLAFGHPFTFSGPTTLGASRAKVLAIVDDDTFGPYKLAAPTEPIGIVDVDRLAGIRGQLGTEIPTLPITQDTTALDTGATRAGGRTDAVQGDGAADQALPDVVITHMLSNIDVTFDQIGAGSSLVRWTISGVDEDAGEPFTVTRENRFTSPFDISIDSVFELFDAVITIQEQRLAEVRLEGIDIDVEIARTVREYKIASVRWAKAGGRFAKRRRLRVRPRQRIRAEVKLVATDGAPTRRVRMSFRAPRRPQKGEITISGGGGGFGEFAGEEALFCALFGECPEGDEDTFADLLDELEGRPRNDELIGEARFRRTRQTVRPQNRVVTGFASLSVRMPGA